MLIPMENVPLLKNLELKYFKRIFFIFVLHFLTSPGVSAKSTQNFYDGCGTTHFCFGHSDCISKQNCDFAMSIHPISDDQFLVTLALDSSHTSMYMASGFGQSPSMADLAVLECVILEGQRLPSAYVSTTGQQKIAPERTSASPPIRVTAHEVVQFGKKRYFTCKFTLNRDFKIGHLSIKLKSRSYFLSIAQGPARQDGTIQKHTEYHVSEKVDLNKVTKIKAKYIEVGLAYRVHGILMCIVYMSLMPVSRIVARFYKETWTDKTIKGKKLWFVIHAGLMYLAAILIVIAYLIIAISYQSWWPRTETAGNHALLGAISIGCLFLQITLPWAIPRHKVILRRVYYKFHVIIGGVSYLLGLTNIILTSSWLQRYQPCETIVLVFVWIFVDLAFSVMLTTVTILSDSTTEDIPLTRSLVSYPLQIYQIEEASYKKPRVTLLILLVVCSASVTIAMSVVMVSLKPCVLKPLK